jgi:hypothetical protein
MRTAELSGEIVIGTERFKIQQSSWHGAVCPTNDKALTTDIAVNGDSHTTVSNV